MNKKYLPNLFLTVLICIGFVECAPLVNAQGTGLKNLESKWLSRTVGADAANRLRSELISSAGIDATEAADGAVRISNVDSVNVFSFAENNRFGAYSSVDSIWVDESDFSPERTAIFDSPSKARAIPQSNSSKQSPNSSKQSSGGYVFPSRHERVRHYIKGVIGPSAFASAAVAAVYNHAYNRPQEWGKSGNALAKRFFSSFGRGAINETVRFGLSEALKLDSSFHKSTRNGFGPRFSDALLETVTSRTRSGRRVVSIPRLSGPYVAGFASLLWMPKRYGEAYALRSGSYSLLGSAAFNLAREFIFRK
jgi:hypothetical protein